MTAEDLYELSFVGESDLSSDGTKVAYVQKMIDNERRYRSHLFVQQVPDGEPVQWTFGKGHDTSPKWSPDGETLAFLSDRSGQQQIWLLAANGGEARQLTFCKNGVGNPVWSPDGQSLLFTTSLGPEERVTDCEVEEAAVGTTTDDATNNQVDSKKKLQPLVIERLRYKADGKGFLDEKYEQLAVINVDGKGLRQLTEGAFHYSGGSWSPDGKAIACCANCSDDPDQTFVSDVFIYSLADDKLTQLTDGSGVFHSPSWAPDGKRLACFGHQLEYRSATLQRVWLLDLATKEKTCLTMDWDVVTADVAISDLRSGHPFAGALWSPTGDGVYILASDCGNTGVYFVHVDGDVRLVYGGERHVYGLAMDNTRTAAVVAVSDWQTPGDLYYLDISSCVSSDGHGHQESDDHNRQEVASDAFNRPLPRVRRLTAANAPLLENITLSQPEPLSYKAEDGKQIHGWLIKPVGFEQGKKYPLILEIHGGPHAMYAHSFFHEFQLLAAKGFAVLYVNPRGSEGYGQAFVDACRGDYGGGDYTDLMAAVDFALATYDFIDADRLGVTGGSYGGFMTNWIVGHTDRFKAAVTQRSISNWLSFFGTSDIGYYFSEWELKADFFADPEKMWHHSPLRLAKNVQTPLLILHGEKDYRCPIEQAEQLFVALKLQRKPVKFVRFPEANHELSRSGEPSLRVARLNYIADWFTQYLSENASGKEKDAVVQAQGVGRGSDIQ
ncbi:S9 family peptidase [Numidum massiliense]|uniref:S9 family peptidase n=1 Tax=Numidum massiliense TaxID=1522315 RepID=UPI0009E9D1DD|nr:S9 family peptidase [Numidum massiliense]